MRCRMRAFHRMLRRCHFDEKRRSASPGPRPARFDQRRRRRKSLLQTAAGAVAICLMFGYPPTKLTPGSKLTLA